MERKHSDGRKRAWSMESEHSDGRKRARSMEREHSDGGKIRAGSHLQYCRQCHHLLHADEIAMTKKLVNRGTDVFYCLDCLALAFEVSRKDLEKKILEFRESGCTLFA